jgi:phosphoglycolate phosphatase-like HAD superfamily hydrolase
MIFQATCFMKLILFDIDGTLVSVDHAVLDTVLSDVIADVLDFHGELPRHELHGKTDRQIFLELCQVIGRPAEEGRELFARFEQALCERWSRSLDTTTIRVHPGVEHLLARLAARDDVALGLLTGNLEHAAGLKLRPHGLDRYFAFGAYGSDAIDRADLPPIALERGNRIHGGRLSYERSLIVGDSHRDIACARAWGIGVLAVSTGSLDADELAGYAPDAVCRTLAEDTFIERFLEMP